MQLDELNIIVASPLWSLSGVNVFTENLVRGLRERDLDARILITRPHQSDEKPMARPGDLPVDELPVPVGVTWRDKCHRTVRYLKKRSPCIFLPNHAYRVSCVSPKLPDDVGIVGILHSDDPEHYEHLDRLGPYWNRIVSVSDTIAHNAHRRHPEFEDRMHTIPYGLPVPEIRTSRDRSRSELHIVYAGRIIQHQKRIMDLAEIVKGLSVAEVPFRLDIIGEGPDREDLEQRIELANGGRQVDFRGLMTNQEVHEILAGADVFLLTSEFEGLPLSLLEAMSRGCVPVVTDIESGVPELVESGKNGVTVPIGAIDDFVAELRQLQKHPSRLEELSKRAHETMLEGPYRVEAMVESHIRVLEAVAEEIGRGAFERPDGPVQLPPRYDITWKDYLPTWIRLLGARVKGFLRRIGVRLP